MAAAICVEAERQAMVSEHFGQGAKCGIRPFLLDQKGHYERKHQPLPRMEAWRGELERMLSANLSKLPRERRTLILIYEELRGLGYLVALVN